MRDTAGDVWLTIRETAQRLGESESTVRSWRNSFRGIIPERTGAEGWRIYPLSVMAYIRDAYARHPKPMAREIRAELTRAAAALTEQAEAPLAGATWQEQLLAEVRGVREDLRRLIALLEQIAPPPADHPP